jgi:hypothetical protein
MQHGDARMCKHKTEARQGNWHLLYVCVLRRGELGLRGSQLQGLTRELEFTRRQLQNAEKCVERAQMESRQQRSGFNSFGTDWE